MEKVQVFLDAFGSAIEKNTEYSHFVYTALVLSDENALRLAKIAQDIAPMLNNQSEDNPDDWARRIDLLARLKTVPFATISLVINKSDISAESLTQQDIFYKYFQRIFVAKIAQNFSAFDIHAAPYLPQELRRDLQKYIDLNGIQRDLFNPDRYFRLLDSPTAAASPLLQIANFISDCIGRIYCVSHQANDFNQAFEILSDSLLVEFFPFSQQTFLPDYAAQSPQNDAAIARIAVEEFVQFVADNNNRPRLTECLEIAKYLLLIYKSSPYKLVSTKELIAVVKRKINKYSQDQLRQHIAQLRDFGLLIVSPQGRYGYKIPNSVSDMVGFYNRYYGNIKPMLSRVQHSNEKLQLKTAGQVDILNLMAHFKNLQQLIAVLQKAAIGSAAPQ
jgi:DNA-binding transcriptional ArsR family regulator